MHAPVQRCLRFQENCGSLQAKADEESGQVLRVMEQHRDQSDIAGPPGKTVQGYLKVRPNGLAPKATRFYDRPSYKSQKNCQTVQIEVDSNELTITAAQRLGAATYHTSPTWSDCSVWRDSVPPQYPPSNLFEYKQQGLPKNGFDKAYIHLARLDDSADFIKTSGLAV